MNIAAMINDFSGVKFEISGADLKEFALTMIELANTEQNDRKQAEGTMSQRDAADYLGKSVTTLIRWSKTGYLRPCAYVGKSPQYSIAALKRIKEGTTRNV